MKVEPPGGDPGRLRPPFAGDLAAPDRSLPFLYRNANKRGVALDLHAADGWRRFTALCERADVLLENLGPDEERRHGLTPAEVRARHPHLVHVAIADFGLSGARASWRLEPLPAFAASGALYASGFPDRPPCWLPGHIAHDCASVFAAIGALAAVLDRARHGDGQTVEISVQEAALQGLTPWSIPLADYTRLYPLLPASPPRNADGNYYVLPAADGFVRVLPGTPRQWKAFHALLGSPDELAGPEWEFIIYRMLSIETIRRVATAALSVRPRADVVSDGRRLGVPIAPMNTPEEFIAEEQTRARGYFRRTAFPHLDDAPFAAAPFVFSATPLVLARPAPPVGGTADFPPRIAEPPAGGEGPVLRGVRVLDFGVVAVGPEVGWVLAELGAEVIKVESRAKLDPLREVTLEPDAPNRAFTFNDECRGQQSVCLDLGTPRGRELARALCPCADVVIENYRGGVMRAWGLDYEDVRRVRPDVIYLASQGYGRTGPLGQLQGFGPLNAAFAGAGWLWNHPDAPYPGASSLNHPDHIASKLAAAAVLAALEHRRRTGEGQLVELAQTEAAAYLQGEFYLQQACTGRPVGPQGNAADYACPHGVYPCRGEDRWCAVAVVGDDAWERLCRHLGWPAEPGLATLGGRLEARARIDARLAEWTAAREAEEVATALQAVGISAMAVLGPDDLRADAHLAARGAIVTVEHPEVGPERHAGNPVRMSRTPVVVAGPAPLLGQHTEEVLTRVLGLSTEDLRRLEDDGVCR